MSFIISDRQHLASSERRPAYRPFHIKDEQCRSFKIDINFGHPLYTSVFDIFALENVCEEPVMIPVVPDGCISMAFQGKCDSMKGWICGAVDEVRKITLKPEEQLIIIQFQPSASMSFLKDSAGLLTNKAEKLGDYIKNGRQILAAASKELPVEEKAMRLSKLIRIRMKGDDSNYLIRYCTDRIFETNGNIKVSELGRETGYSERYLGKVFEKYAGLSPKTYCEIMRLQSSLKKIMDESNRAPLLNLALDSGFFDHAHMNRCYRRFLHCSSGRLRKKGFACLDYDKVDSYYI